MYRPIHSAPDHDHDHSLNGSATDFHHGTSEQSLTPLQPLMASKTQLNPSPQGKRPPLAHSYPPTPGKLESGHASDANVHGWDRASHFLHEGMAYDPSNAKEDYLRMAKDDVPDNKVGSDLLLFLQSWAHPPPATLGSPSLPLPH